MPSDDRLPKLLVLALIALAVASIQFVPGRRTDPNQFVVRCDEQGRVFAQGDGQVGTLPALADRDWFVRSDLVPRTREAVVRWLGDRPRDPLALRLEAPGGAPWTSLVWLTYPAGFPDTRIPTLALRPVGVKGVDIPLYGDRGLSDDLLYRVRHVHLRARRITVFEETVTSYFGQVWVETEKAPRAVRYRSPGFDAASLGALDRLLRTDRDTRGDDGWGDTDWRVALTWDESDTQLTFAELARVATVVLALEPAEFLFHPWAPDA